MIVAFTGIRELSPGSYADVELAVIERALYAEELRFGGALGSDTVALEAACDNDVRRVVFVPFTLAKQPREAREVVGRCATDVVELRLPNASASYIERNRTMIEGADLVVAFTDGRPTGGTASTIRDAARRGIPVEVILVASKARQNPRLDRDLGAPAYTWKQYVSYRKTKVLDLLTDTVRRMKKGEHTEIELRHLSGRLVREFKRVPALRNAEAIVPMPRSTVGVESDLRPVVEAIAARTGQVVLGDWFKRVAAPSGGAIKAGRLRFGADEHARTMAVVGPERPRSVVLFDNVLTLGGTMAGAIQAVKRDAPGVKVVGFSILLAGGR